MNEVTTTSDSAEQLYQNYFGMYKRRADGYMNAQNRSSLCIIIFSAVNTGLIALSGMIPGGVVIATVVSAIVAIATSLQSSFKYKDLWVRYREAQWKLAIEKMRFDMSASDYGSIGEEEKTNKFAERIIDIIDWERKGWRDAFEEDTEGQP